MTLSGTLNAPWWAVVLYTLVMTHITIAAVTIYLHRGMAHRALDFHPAASHFFRAWLWLTTGMNTKEWVAIHRKHHAKVDSAEDPHSPVTHGIKKVLFTGVLLYVKEALNKDTVARFGAGTPADWLERKVYTPLPWAGLLILVALDVLLFGLVGAVVFVVQVAWIPFWAAGVVNGLGHYLGYRNFDSTDASRNLSPWGVLIGGEELHNNHHAHPTSAKLSFRAHEFDIGWTYIQLLQKAGLVKVKKTNPRRAMAPLGSACGVTTLQAVIANRYLVLRDYALLLKSTSAKELSKPHYRRLRSVWLRLRSADLKADDVSNIEAAYTSSDKLKTLAAYRSELCALWDDATATETQLVERLNAWCRRAEASGSPCLEAFSLNLRRYA